MLKRHYFMISLSMLIIFVGSMPLAFSQEKSEEPFNVITLKVTAPNGTWAVSSVIEGDSLTFLDEKTKSGFAFVPTVSDEKERTVAVKVLQVGNGSTPELVESLNISIGSPKSTGSSFNIEVQAIAKHLPNNSTGTAALKKASHVASSALQQCCVSCGGYRVCSNCSVSTACGCCCTNRDTCCTLCQG